MMDKSRMRQSDREVTGSGTDSLPTGGFHYGQVPDWIGHLTFFSTCGSVPDRQQSREN